MYYKRGANDRVDTDRDVGWDVGGGEGGDLLFTPAENCCCCRAGCVDSLLRIW